MSWHSARVPGTVVTRSEKTLRESPHPPHRVAGAQVTSTIGTMSDSTGAGAAHPDACPGALRPHHAVDGAVVRIRLPGGRISAGGLRTLTDASCRWGDGRLDVTARGNLQLRGLDPGVLGRLAEVLRSAQLLPSVAHERVRNIVASPLSGLDSVGQVDVAPLVAEVDRRLCADAESPALGGRFLFACDDGRGDTLALGADVTWSATGDNTGALYVCGRDTGLRPPRDLAAPALLTAAAEFLRLRAGDTGVWRVRDLPGGAEVLTAVLPRALRTLPVEPVTSHRVPGTESSRPSAGPLHRDGRLTAHVVTPPLGRLTAAQAHLLAELANGELANGELAGTANPAANADLIFTPWRDVVVPAPGAGAEVRLRRAGLATSANSPWQGISACVGPAGCATALAPVRRDAARLVELRSPTGPSDTGPSDTGQRTQQRVHWSGCSRRCGTPSETHLAVIATTPDTYEIDAAPPGITAAEAPAHVARVLENQVLENQ